MSLTVPSGDFLSILGPSGCGKSSLISTIAGFKPPQAGSVLVDGELVTGPGFDRGVVFQQPTLFPWKTVWHNVEFGLKRREVPKQERRHLVDGILRKIEVWTLPSIIQLNSPEACSNALAWLGCS